MCVWGGGGGGGGGYYRGRREIIRILTRRALHTSQEARPFRVDWSVKVSFSLVLDSLVILEKD